MLDMTVLISELIKANGRKRRDPMADPLDGAEWQGLHWALRLFDLFSGEGRGQADKQKRSQTSLRHRPAQCSAPR